MKTLLTILLALFITTTVYSQVDSTVKVITTLPDSSLVTFSKVYKDVTESLTGLAEGLKVGATYVFEVLVKQQLVNSITYLILILLSFFLIINWFKAYKSTEEWSGKEAPTGLGVVRTIQLCLGSATLIWMIFYINNIITGFVNPDYGAIQEIINFTR